MEIFSGPIFKLYYIKLMQVTQRFHYERTTMLYICNRHLNIYSPSTPTSSSKNNCSCSLNKDHINDILASFWVPLTRSFSRLLTLSLEIMLDRAKGSLFWEVQCVLLDFSNYFLLPDFKPPDKKRLLILTITRNMLSTYILFLFVKGNFIKFSSKVLSKFIFLSLKVSWLIHRCK